MPDTYTESIPIINDNFDKVINSVGDLVPRTFSTANTGARPSAGSMLAVVALAYDRPQYTSYAALTPRYDVYVDSGTNAAGTMTIDNTAGSGTITVAIGDYFVVTSEIVSQPTTPRIFIATSTASVLVGASGSCTVVAERCGTDYTVTSIDMTFGGANIAFPTYYAGQSETGANLVVLRAVSITPTYGGGGGGGGVFTLTTTGGSGVENDSNYLWPNGASLSSAQKSLVVQHHLNITTATPSFTTSTTDPYTANFATSTIRVVNHDSAAHSIYVYVTGTIFSGITGSIFK